MTDKFPQIPDFAWISHALPLKAVPFEILRGVEGKPKIKMCGEGSVTKIKHVGRGVLKKNKSM